MLLVDIFILFRVHFLIAKGAMQAPPIRNLQAVIAKGDRASPSNLPLSSKVDHIHIVMRQYK